MPSVKLNVVAMKNFNDDEFADFAELTRDKDIDVRFIEFMPFDSNEWSKDKFIPFTAIKE
jgi:cyclic pyranopterin phosphate synthase